MVCIFLMIGDLSTKCRYPTLNWAGPCPRPAPDASPQHPDKRLPPLNFAKGNCVPLDPLRRQKKTSRLSFGLFLFFRFCGNVHRTFPQKQPLSVSLPLQFYNGAKLNGFLIRLSQGDALAFVLFGFYESDLAPFRGIMSNTKGTYEHKCPCVESQFLLLAQFMFQTLFFLVLAHKRCNPCACF